MCPTVVDAVRDRLKITGLTHNDAPPDIIGRPKPADPTQDALNDLWRRNRMEVRAGIVHTDALALGDSYVIVWPNQMGDATLYPNDGTMVAVRYDEDKPDLITFAAKVWRDDNDYVRCNLFYEDRIEKYITRTKSRKEDSLKAESFVEFTPAEGNAEGGPVIANPYGKVPVFHFDNMGSELEEAIPVQDMLNKTVRDMLIGGEEQALKQRYATGVEAAIDPQTGKPVNQFNPGEFWAARNENAKFGELTGADLSQLQQVKEGFKIDMAMVTGIPAHYFFAGSGDVPSGKALQTLEFRLTSKVGDRQTMFGNSWEDAFSFALRIETGREVTLDALWANTTPKDDAEHQTGVVERVEKMGVPTEQGLKELGYTDEEIERFTEMQKSAQPKQVNITLPGINRAAPGLQVTTGPKE